MNHLNSKPSQTINGDNNNQAGRDINCQRFTYHTHNSLSNKLYAVLIAPYISAAIVGLVIFPTHDLITKQQHQRYQNQAQELSNTKQQLSWSTATNLKLEEQLARANQNNAVLQAVVAQNIMKEKENSSASIALYFSQLPPDDLQKAVEGLDQINQDRLGETDLELHFKRLQNENRKKLDGSIGPEAFYA